MENSLFDATCNIFPTSFPVSWPCVPSTLISTSWLDSCWWSCDGNTSSLENVSKNEKTRALRPTTFFESRGTLCCLRGWRTKKSYRLSFIGWEGVFVCLLPGRREFELFFLDRKKKKICAEMVSDIRAIASALLVSQEKTTQKETSIATTSYR